MRPMVESHTPNVGSSLRCIHNSGTGYRFKWHVHQAYELTFIRVGHGQRFVGDSIESYKSEDLALIPPQMPHTWTSDEACTEVACTVIHFHPDDWGNLLSLPECDALRPLLSDNQQGLLFPSADRVLKPLHDGMPEDPLARLFCLFHILNELRQSPFRPIASIDFRYRQLSASSNNLINELCSWICQHYRQAINQQSLAQRYGMSNSALSRLFKRATGRTFSAYLHDIRIARACAALRDSDESITSVCYDCGFGNLSNFNRVFKRLKGLSPRAYRQGFR